MKTILLSTFLFISTSCIFAQNDSIINLPQPKKNGGKPLLEAINERQSSREFVNKPFTNQELSNLLWAAFGINRTGEHNRTAPSSRNDQELDIYIAAANGTYLYDAKNNSLHKITSDDIRSKTGVQDYVERASVNLLYVIKKDKSSSKEVTDKIQQASVCAGAISQNVYLFCASENLSCVIRASYDINILANLLKLNSNQQVILAESVGYTK